MVEINWQVLAGVVLIGVSVVGALLKTVVPKLTAKMPTVLPVVNDKPVMVRSSDAAAPDGVTEYLKMILEASPTATPDIRWKYASEGLTEAGVLRAEVQRLGAPVS